MSFVLIRLGLALFESMVIWQIIASVVPYAAFILLLGILFLWDETETVIRHGNGGFLRRYRNLQVLEKLVNSCVRYRIFSIVAMASPILQVFAGFALVKHHSSLELSHLVFLGMEVFMSFFFGNIVIFGGAGAIFGKSKGLLVKEANRCRSHKILRREIQALMPLKIWLGSNFVDVLTPIVIQHFCIVQTMNLLLLT